jgi:hypothetical protein
VANRCPSETNQCPSVANRCLSATNLAKKTVENRPFRSSGQKEAASVFCRRTD